MLNIEELTVSSFDSQLSQIKFNRLKKFKVFKLLAENLDDFEIFIENNAKNVKHLDIRIGDIGDELDYHGGSINWVKRLLKVISKSINLVHLKINVSRETIDNSFINYWEEIPINCKQIKSLNIRYYNYNNFRLNKNIFLILKSFKQLKRLDIKFGKNLFKELIEFHPIQDLKGLKRLTHLSISGLSREFEAFDETILSDIDIIFPKLQSLKIDISFYASEWTAQVLNRLTFLRKVELTIKNPEIISEIKRLLVQNSKKLKLSIHVQPFCRPISHQPMFKIDMGQMFSICCFLIIFFVGLFENLKKWLDRTDYSS